VVADRLETLRGLGVTVKLVAGDRIRVEPASKIPTDLIPLIRQAKPAILEALRSRSSGLPFLCPFVCDWCGCRFNNRAALSYHVRVAGHRAQ